MVKKVIVIILVLALTVTAGMTLAMKKRGVSLTDLLGKGDAVSNIKNGDAEAVDSGSNDSKDGGYKFIEGVAKGLGMEEEDKQRVYASLNKEYIPLTDRVLVKDIQFKETIPQDEVASYFNDKCEEHKPGGAYDGVPSVECFSAGVENKLIKVNKVGDDGLPTDYYLLRNIYLEKTKQPALYLRNYPYDMYAVTSFEYRAPLSLDTALISRVRKVNPTENEVIEVKNKINDLMQEINGMNSEKLRPFYNKYRDEAVKADIITPEVLNEGDMVANELEKFMKKAGTKIESTGEPVIKYVNFTYDMSMAEVYFNIPNIIITPGLDYYTGKADNSEPLPKSASIRVLMKKMDDGYKIQNPVKVLNPMLEHMYSSEIATNEFESATEIKLINLLNINDERIIY